MKLLYCTVCNDIISLRAVQRFCACGQSSGRYSDQVNAEMDGPCIPLGFANRSFLAAVRDRRTRGNGVRFEAFVITKECVSIDLTKTTTIR